MTKNNLTERQKRLGQALRQNLLKRKQQQRGRQSQVTEEQEKLAPAKAGSQRKKEESVKLLED